MAKKTHEHAEHDARTTTDHDTIRKWVEARSGRPATVKGTAKKGDDAGILRIDFPQYSGVESLQEVTWDDFFDKFDKENLVFLYQEETADGEPSRFCKFVSHETADAAE